MFSYRIEWSTRSDIFVLLELEYIEIVIKYFVLLVDLIVGFLNKVVPDLDHIIIIINVTVSKSVLALFKLAN